MKPLLIFLSLLILSTSCESIIEIDLDYMKPKLVIEGVISDSDNQFIIKLSKTTDYFTRKTNPPVSGAVILLTDNSGAVVKLNETEPGSYLAEHVHAKSRVDYTLSILSEGDTYMAKATIPQKVNIDSLTCRYNPKSIIYEVGYVVSCHFSDPEENRNFYRLKTYNINDKTKARISKELYDDDVYNGNNVELKWSNNVYQQNDTVVVELYSLDENTYEYYKTLFPISGGSEMMSFTTPANPNTNLSDGALGYFGAYTVSRDTIIISAAR
ncbi:MAG: DUF4249 domain-containing protein [Bacteroidales bacterium]|nr:DUF4249 domain-containing protein [Bacteroidales bacterium]